MSKKLEEVNIFVLHDGTWKETESKWTFVGGRCTVVSVPKRVTYVQLLHKLYTTLSVNGSLFDLKLEVVYPCGGQPLPPVTIVDDNDVSTYVRETVISVKHRTPLCVTAVPKDICVGEPSCNNFVEDDNDSDSFVQDTTYVQDFQQCTYEPYKSPYGFQQHVPDTTPVPNTYKAKQEAYCGSWPIIDLNESPKDDFGLFNSSPPRAYLKTTPPKGDDDANFFRLPTFTSDDVAGGSGPVDLESLERTEDLYVGQIFDNKKALRKAASLYAIQENFEFRVCKSSPDLWYIICKDPSCQWRLRVKQIDFTDMFKVSKFVNVHTCQADTHGRDHRQASPWVIADIIKNKIVEDGPKYLPRQIITDMREEYGFEMTYEKAWRCKEAVLNLVRGTPEASYAALPSYLYMLHEKNPGTLQHFVLDNDGHSFKYCFFSLGASRAGFRFCRPVICVDGTFLKSKLAGIMLCAVALDADNHLFPIAIAVVDSENHDSWIYFMARLKEALGGDVEDLVFVSDRHQSITNALDLVFPKAHHGACYCHIKRNVHARFKTNVCDANMYAAAYAYRRSVFGRHFSNILARDPRIATYLYEIGFHKWARSYFPGKRYNVMTSNYAESFNNTTKEARACHVTSLLEFVRFKVQHWFFIRREYAGQSSDTLSPIREKNLRQLCEKARYMRVHQMNQNEMQVIDGEDDVVVNLESKECTCGEFQVTGMPCVHAAAAASKKRNYSLYTLCSAYYTLQSFTNTYAYTIYPLGNMDDWIVPDNVRQIRVGVPVPRNTIGRPRKKMGRPKNKRIPSKGEHIVAERRCSRCKLTGHNKTKCTTLL